MERVGVLTRALRRLDAAAAELEPLEGAERGLAALTRVRLDGLISPGRGDEALAAVLARGAPAGEAGTDVESRRPRRLAAPLLAAGPGRALPAAATAVAQRGAVVPAAGAADAADARARPVPPPSAPARRLDVAAFRKTRRRTFAAVDSEVAAPPRGFDAVAGVDGLEWIAPRVPGGAEPAKTMLVDGAPDGASPSQWAGAPDSAPQPRVLPPPTDPNALATPAVEVERATAPGETRSWPAPRPGEPRALPRAGGQGLEALVRAWQDSGDAPAERAESAPIVIPIESGDTATSTSTRPSRAHARRAASEREEETIAFGDALARVLVAELRRYGIEVDAG